MGVVEDAVVVRVVVIGGDDDVVALVRVDVGTLRNKYTHTHRQTYLTSVSCRTNKQHCKYKMGHMPIFASLPARRRTTLSGRPHHAVWRSDRQSRPQIHHVWLCRSAKEYTWPLRGYPYSLAVPRITPSLGDRLFAVAACVIGTICRRHFVKFIPLKLSYAICLHGLFSFCFQLHFVRHPCARVPASPWSYFFD